MKRHFSLTDISYMPTPFKFNGFFGVSVLIVFCLLFSTQLILTELGVYLKSVLQKSVEVDVLSGSIEVVFGLYRIFT